MDHMSFLTRCFQKYHFIARHIRLSSQRNIIPSYLAEVLPDMTETQSQRRLSQPQSEVSLGIHPDCGPIRFIGVSPRLVDWPRYAFPNF